VRTQQFYEKYGAKTIVIARFVPIIRTFAPVLAGVGNMQYRRFLIYNVVGGIGWVASMSWAGYLLGQTVPNISKHIHVLVIVIIILSVIPIAVEVYRERRKVATTRP
jgi:membrane-associated protein